MQEMTPEICKNAPQLATMQLIDHRDWKTYWVTKLKDGNCWMTQNLDYDGGGTKIDSPGAWTTSASTSSDIAVTNATAAYYDPGEKVASNSTLVDATNDTDKHLLIGNYYSWQAAISACPSGWRLPTGNTDGEFQTLANVYGAGGNLTGSGTKMFTEPLNFQRGGNISYNAKLTSVGKQSSYWSSTANSNSQAYYMFIESSVSEVSNSRYLGLSVRCLVSGS